MSLDALSPELVEYITNFCPFPDTVALYSALEIVSVPDAVMRKECKRLGVSTIGMCTQYGTPRICDILVAMQANPKCIRQYLTPPLQLTYLNALWGIRVLTTNQEMRRCICERQCRLDFVALNDIVCLASEEPQPTVQHRFWVQLQHHTAGMANALVEALTVDWRLHENAAANIAMALKQGVCPASLFTEREDQLTAALCTVGANVCPNMKDTLSRRGYLRWSHNPDFCTVIALVVGAVVLGKDCMDSVQSAARLACQAPGTEPKAESHLTLSFDTQHLAATIAAVFRLARFERAATAEGRPPYCATIELVCEYMDPESSPETIATAADAYIMLAPRGVPTAHIIQFVNGIADVHGFDVPSTLPRLVATGLFEARPAVSPSDVLAVLEAFGMDAFDPNCIQLLSDDSLRARDALAMALRANVSLRTP